MLHTGHGVLPLFSKGEVGAAGYFFRIISNFHAMHMNTYKEMAELLFSVSITVFDVIGALGTGPRIPTA